MITANYFSARYNNRRKHNQHFELPFFMINLHFTSKQLPTYRKTCLLLVNSIYLVSSSLEIQRRIPQIKYTTSFVTLSEKKLLQTFKNSNYKKLFLKCISCYYLLRLTFLVPCDNWDNLRNLSSTRTDVFSARERLM